MKWSIVGNSEFLHTYTLFIVCNLSHFAVSVLTVPAKNMISISYEPLGHYSLQCSITLVLKTWSMTVYCHYPSSLLTILYPMGCKDIVLPLVFFRESIKCTRKCPSFPTNITYIQPPS